MIKPYKRIPIFLQGDRVAYITAGPTRALPDGYGLVRCAEEIKVDEDRVAFDVSTGDFRPLNERKLISELPDLIEALYEDDDIPLYVGCMGGTGRTGTLLAILAGQHPDMDGDAAIDYIRQVYKPGAVETPEQEEQVRTFSSLDPSVLRHWSGRLETIDEVLEAQLALEEGYTSPIYGTTLKDARLTWDDEPGGPEQPMERELKFTDRVKRWWRNLIS